MHNKRMFDWDDLRHLIAVSRQGSTLAAARTLGVNQSTVHRRLAELEREIGLTLMKRHPSGYRLTELGEALIDDVLAVETAIQMLDQQIRALKLDLRGVVRLTCPEPTVPRIVATGLLDRFHERYPGLQVEFVTSDRYLDLSKGEADVAFRSGEPGSGAIPTPAFTADIVPSMLLLRLTIRALGTASGSHLATRWFSMMPSKPSNA